MTIDKAKSRKLKEEEQGFLFKAKSRAKLYVSIPLKYIEGKTVGVSKPLLGHVKDRIIEHNRNNFLVEKAFCCQMYSFYFL